MIKIIHNVYILKQLVNIFLKKKIVPAGLKSKERPRQKLEQLIRSKAQKSWFKKKSNPLGWKLESVTPTFILTYLLLFIIYENMRDFFYTYKYSSYSC